VDLISQYGPWVFAMAVTGIAAGFVAGLLGVGGGIIIVPVLDLVLGVFGVDPSIRMKIAVATSLATIILTSVSSARSHYKKGAIDFGILKSWGPMIFAGVIVGTLIAGLVDGRVLSLVFATVALLVAANMILRAQSHALMAGFPNAAVKGGLGIVVGTISAMMGIGGGTLSVPILTAFGTDIRRAVATGAAIGFVIAIPGTIGYIIAGWNAEGLPPGSLGYVNLLAFICIVPLSMLAAPWGAKVAHSIDRKYLSYGFGVFLVATSIKMFWSLVG
jgi:uncharacterized membrane protein YfcA